MTLSARTRRLCAAIAPLALLGAAPAPAADPALWIALEPAAP
jgi:hypothetical protein